MSRYHFPYGRQQRFLEDVKRRTKMSFGELALKCDCHRRSFSDWYHERNTIPAAVANTLSELSGVHIPKCAVEKDDYSHACRAGRRGAEVSHARYGNPGTPEGRSLGGKRSLQTHRRLNTKFHNRKEFRRAPRSILLAEFIGIMLGDGSLTKHQATITLHRVDDKAYSQWVHALIQDLFQLQSSIRQRNNTVELIVSSVGLVQYLQHLGLMVGDKVRQQVSVPDWIQNRNSYAIACMRGLIDTDGCAYIDRHANTSRVYESFCLAFSNRSQPLLRSVDSRMKVNGMNSRRYRDSVKLRRKEDVHLYFSIVGSHNEKHKKKYKQFFNVGEVA